MKTRHIIAIGLLTATAVGLLAIGIKSGYKPKIQTKAENNSQIVWDSNNNLQYYQYNFNNIGNTNLQNEEYLIKTGHLRIWPNKTFNFEITELYYKTQNVIITLQVTNDTLKSNFSLTIQGNLALYCYSIENNFSNITYNNNQFTLTYTMLVNMTNTTTPITKEIEFNPTFSFQTTNNMSYAGSGQNTIFYKENVRLAGENYSAGQTAGYNTGYTAGETDGYNSGFSEGQTAGYNSGYTAGYTAGETDGYNSGYTAGETDGYQTGYTAGESAGYDTGYTAGYTAGETDGYQTGHATGVQDGYSAGYTAGNTAGQITGYQTGYTAGESAGYDTGYTAGYTAGETAGYQDGYENGVAFGYDANSFNNPLDITGLMLNILTMPFTFINQAFDVTLWPGTQYAFNIARFVKGLLAILAILFIIRLFTSGFSIIGNYTGNINKQAKLKSKKTTKISKNTAKKE